MVYVPLGVQPGLTLLTDVASNCHVKGAVSSTSGVSRAWFIPKIVVCTDSSRGLCQSRNVQMQLQAVSVALPCR